MTLYAYCRPKSGAVVQRVLLDATAQPAVENYFNQQFTAFIEGVDEEVTFDGEWKPADDEILTIDLPSDVEAIVAATKKNAVSIPVIDAPNFEQEAIKGLFVKRSDGKILLQAFTAQQLLLRRHWFVLDKHTFKEASSPGFTIATNLAAVIEGGSIKFKSFPLLRRIFDLTEFYQEATDAEVEGFASHIRLHSDDVEALKKAATPMLRKRIHAVVKTGILDAYSAPQFVSRAKKVGMGLVTKGGKIVVPSDKKDLKDFLSFMENKIYEGVLDKKVYVANAKRLRD